MPSTPTTPREARASAITYSLVETAKDDPFNPFAYLEYLFEWLPNLDAAAEKVMLLR